MLRTGWVDLLQRIPPAEQDRYLLVTSVGIEVAIMHIVSMEKDYLVIRGRLAGTSDAGKSFFIPYDQINFVGSVSPVMEESVRAMFDGRPGQPAVVTAAAPLVEAPPPTDETPLAQVEKHFKPASPTPLATEAPKPATKPPLPGKAALLERLRARSRGDESKPVADK